MGYTVADMFNLFQFSEGLNGLEVCRQTGIKRTQMQFAKAEDVLTKKTNELMVRRFGENWNSIENLRKYQEKKNIVTNDFDGGRMKEIRLRKDKTIKEFANQLGIGHERLSSIESGKTKPFHWKEYVKFKKFYKDDLLKESSIKKKNAKVITKEFITFKNVGGRWEMGKLVKQEAV
ncbi:helix-turn-helix domain-containing protein [Jeotgalibaca porci]|uniref:helix-turn-helix domain-containing protein n=1 Tax=Jeotgalibaca porci TaxID=1868793 RepID=UPI00359FE243